MALVKIFFGPNETTLTPDDVETLNELVADLKKRPAKKIAVSGNADSQGQAAANKTTSQKRAEAVQRFLTDNGIDPKTIKVVANGSSSPAASNDTVDGRAQNRRVDVVTDDGAGTAVAASAGDAGEKDGAAPPLLPAQDEVPLASDALAVSAGAPWVGGTGILAPPRAGNDAAFFADGRDFMADVAAKMRAAKKIIYITDWAINPFVHLVRSPTPLQESETLLDILKTAVIRQVVVRVMLWDSNKKRQNNRDAEAEPILEKVGVRVHRHQWDKNVLENNRFSHHQKTIIMDAGDSRVAYIGGLDLTSGRWDESQHTLVADPAIWRDDHKPDVDPKQPDYYSGDFYNPNFPTDTVYTGNVAKRGTIPRMPWHDVHARVAGPAAVDIERNFVQRWSFKNSEPGLPVPPATPPAGAGKQVVQIVRSASPDSIGPDSAKPVEASIQQAYINAIRMSQHYVYIENQFFSSDFGSGSPIHNKIMNELATRLEVAIEKKQKFRVKIVLPVHPEGLVDGPNLQAYAGVQELMHWQYRTLVRPAGQTSKVNSIAPTSLVGRVLKSLGGIDAVHLAQMHEFLEIYNLRNHAKLSGGATVTEQIYVHSKLMIVDDRVVIVGSANINDRSLLGSRDTELSAIIVDNETKLIPVDGKNRFVRNFAHKARLQLWQEHLGVSADKILDPIAQATHDLWHKTATDNTAIYEAVFPNVPSNLHADLPTQNKAKAFDPAQAARLGNIKGHVTLHPLDWLRNEDLETTGLPDEVMTFLEPDDDGTAVA